jgi:predicted phosphodiesterase
MRTFSSRRDFLHASVAAAATVPILPGHQSVQGNLQPQDHRTAFCLISDTHYLANSDSPGSLDERSQQLCGRLIDTLNHLPGQTIPDEAGGGSVQDLAGIIHAGDVIDSGDKQGKLYEQMQRTEWDAYVADFGLTGREGKLRFPVYEVHGNHDSPHGSGLAIDGMIERNRRRTHTGLSGNNLHCSWNWGHIHFINLGLVVGHDKSVAQRRRYNPMDSLDFLIADLQQHASDPNRPVIITHHVDVLRYSRQCEPADEKNLSLEWHPCDVQAYYRAIRPYNVLAVLYGHTHVRNIQLWDGSTAKPERGVTLLNVDNASHFSGSNQAFFYIEINTERMLVRECATQDGWRSHYWTPMTWTRPLIIA